MSDDPSPETVSRQLIRRLDRAALSTSSREREGHPCGSLVLYAADHRAQPLLLLSDLADHTGNLREDPRCSLLIDGTAGLEDPLTGPRVTLMGVAELVTDENLAARFIARHPGAALYAGFGDFHLFRIRIDSAHLVAGFGNIHWLDGKNVTLSDVYSALAEAEADIVRNMNADHADAIGRFANVTLGLPGVGWRLTGVDPEGMDLRRGGDIARLDFENQVRDPESARVEIARLTARD